MSYTNRHYQSVDDSCCVADHGRTAEVDGIYSEDSVSEYRPEAVAVRLRCRITNGARRIDVFFYGLFMDDGGRATDVLN